MNQLLAGAATPAWGEWWILLEVHHSISLWITVRIILNNPNSHWLSLTDCEKNLLYLCRVFEDQHQEIDPLQFARRMLEGFNRALYIEMQVDDDPETLHLKAQQIAMDLSLRLEKTTGSFALLEEVIRQALDIVKDSG